MTCLSFICGLVTVRLPIIESQKCVLILLYFVVQLLGSKSKSDLHEKVLPPKSLIIAYNGIHAQGIY
jgi:hypothetical protein